MRNIGLNCMYIICIYSRLLFFYYNWS